MDLTILRYIVTVAEEKRLSKASEKLFVTSAALSLCIKKVERDLGAPLFEKIDSRTFIPTNVGQIYIDAAKKILGIKEAAYREIQDVNLQKRGRFSLGVTPNRGIAVFSKIFPLFHKTFPNIKIDLRETYMNMIQDSVLAGSIDIGIVTPVDTDIPDVSHELLDQEEIVLALPKAHPLAFLAGEEGQGAIDLFKLNLFKDDEWILTNKGTMHRNLTDSIFEKSGISPSRILLETSSTDLHLTAIEEGVGIGLISMPRFAFSSKFVVLHILPSQFRKLFAIYRKNYALSESQRFLIDKFKEFYARAAAAPARVHKLSWEGHRPPSLG